MSSPTNFFSAIFSYKLFSTYFVAQKKHLRFTFVNPRVFAARLRPHFQVSFLSFKSELVAETVGIVETTDGTAEITTEETDGTIETDGSAGFIFRFHAF